MAISSRFFIEINFHGFKILICFGLLSKVVLVTNLVLPESEIYSKRLQPNSSDCYTGAIALVRVYPTLPECISGLTFRDSMRMTDASHTSDTTAEQTSKPKRENLTFICSLCAMHELYTHYGTGSKGRDSKLE